MESTEEKYLEYNDKCQAFLFYSAYFLIIPTIYAFSVGQYIFSFMSFCVFVTSLLRWGYRKNETYKYIDHTYAKFLPISATIASLFLSLKYEEYVFILILFVSASAIFITGMILHYKFCNTKNNIFHMLVHVYAVFSGCIFIYLTDIKRVRLDRLLESSGYSEFLP